MTGTPRWFTEFGDGHAQWYLERFRTLAAAGADLEGEARVVDAVVPRRARILDAGCGSGRVAAALHTRGHQVVGVDVDPALVAAARAEHPGPEWVVADLAALDLAGDPFDAIVLAGNVLVFVAPGSEQQVLRRLRAHLRPDGRLVVGFATDRHYPLADFDADAERAGLQLEHRFGTWDLRPWTAAADFAVSVLTAATTPDGAPPSARRAASRDARPR